MLEKFWKDTFASFWKTVFRLHWVVDIILYFSTLTTLHHDVIFDVYCNSMQKTRFLRDVEDAFTGSKQPLSGSPDCYVISVYSTHGKLSAVCDGW